MKRNFTYEVTRHLLYMYITHTHTHHCVIAPPYASSLHVRFTHPNNHILPTTLPHFLVSVSICASTVYPRLRFPSFLPPPPPFYVFSIPAFVFSLVRCCFSSFTFACSRVTMATNPGDPSTLRSHFFIFFLPDFTLASPAQLPFSLLFFSPLLLFHSFSKFHSSTLLQSFLLFV